ncbi:uncharacterized protein LOC127862217 isoform X2 [Dreissena polymorpha]|uniref:uncharacterized protein LOC127862217 isoform X2 n=1 Tax=Dreissena polymorpha TaxID=45954 RepID=UPI002263EDC0|nr:uncharacterized protein LOC127862217 isoform X2 [Dreissena polymorpha]
MYAIQTIIADSICKVEIEPSSQIVVAGSTVVFSCESDAPGTHSWLRQGKALVPAVDGIQARQVSADESVLVIARADARRHKGAFSCVVQYGNGKREEKRTKLDFVNPNRLPSGFPLVRPQMGNSGLSGVPQEGPATVELRCALETPEEGVDWRWIKTGSDNVTTVLDDDSERIDEDDGILRISPAETGDSGTYVCVADNSRGNAYGPSATINIQIEKPQQCKLDGETYQIGETRQSAGDPCMTCMCLEGAVLRCRSVGCRPQRCPEGQEFHPSNVTCCDGECRPKVIPKPTISRQEEGCRAENGSLIPYGVTLPSADPCVSCTCFRTSGLQCRAVGCVPKRCPLGQVFRKLEGKCCDGDCVPEGLCKDKDGRFTVREGDIFQPDGKRPCEACVCRGGVAERCTEAVCDEPPCARYRRLPETCCGYECLDDDKTDDNDDIGRVKTVDVDDLDDLCVGFGGQKVREGDNYQPGADPCLTCICEDGRAAFCRSIACAPSNMQCQNQTRVPGKCCQYECLDTLMSEEIAIVLGVLYVRQVGPGAILVQWKVPEGSEGLIERGSNMTVYVTVMDGRNSYTKALAAGQVRSYMYHVRDYELGKRMLVTVNGTLGRAPDVKMMVTRAAEVSLDNKVRTTLNLNDALGHVFESRGSDPWGGYSIPRGFKPVARSSKVKNMLNPDSFHRVETSVYDEEPCPHKACGLVRFFLYTLDGEVTNVVSLLFENDQDFEWAEAHL